MIQMYTQNWNKASAYTSKTVPQKIYAMPFPLHINEQIHTQFELSEVTSDWVPRSRKVVSHGLERWHQQKFVQKNFFFEKFFSYSILYSKILFLRDYVRSSSDKKLYCFSCSEYHFKTKMSEKFDSHKYFERFWVYSKKYHNSKATFARLRQIEFRQETFLFLMLWISF